MEFSDLVQQRYSCKKFDAGRKVEKAKLDAILQAGRLAPTAKNFQEQRIYVVESPEFLAKIDKLTPCRYGAPTCLVVAFDKNNVFTYPGGKRDSGVEDASIVATHMMLAATNEGVDNCWINFFDPELMARELGLPENEEVLMMLDLGYAAEGITTSPLHNKRKELSETVSYLKGNATGKTLVAYFSATGVTARVAGTLAEAIGADLHEIKPEQAYTPADLDWNNPKSRSSVEMHDKDFRPAVAGRVENMEQYERIFVGFPIWWYVAPAIINTFLEQYDLTGKKVIPFATSGGSPMGNTNRELQSSCKGALLMEGRRFESKISAFELKTWAEKF